MRTAPTRPTSRRDLVIGTAAGYTWPELRPWVLSLRQSGYAGDICLFTSPLDPETRDQLRHHQVHCEALPRLWTQRSPQLRRILHSFHARPLHLLVARLAPRSDARATPERMKPVLRFCAEFQHIGCSRFFHYLCYLTARPGTYSRILITDVRDVVFQANPFAEAWPEGLVCPLETRLVTLETQQANTDWLTTLYGRTGWSHLAKQRVSCAGVTLGTEPAILTYLARLSAELIRRTPQLIGQGGLDQAAHNFLLWSDRLPPALRPENGHGPVATLHGEDLSTLRYSSDGLVLKENGRPVPIVHQYDRHPEFARQLFSTLGLA